MKFVKVRNGNYDILFDLETGTKIRKNNEDCFIPEKPESMDVKITNMCDRGCAFCHEASTKDGKHGDIMNAKFLETLLPYTELAIGGGNPLEHPDLIPFLEKCKKLKLIPNMTINQFHFMKDIALVKELADHKLIYGLGVSLVNPSKEFIELVKQFPNAVIHMINGVHKLEDYQKLYDNNLKILILGYKEFRRGNDFYKSHLCTTEEIKSDIYDHLDEITKHFAVVSFDNLALAQLDVKRLLTEDEWNQFFMGKDGTHTLFVDLVENTFSTSSTTPINERQPLLDDIKPMFDYVRNHQATI